MGLGGIVNPGEQCSRVCTFERHAIKRDQPGVGTIPPPMAGSDCVISTNFLVRRSICILVHMYISDP